ncbi:MAG: DsbA family protein [SAR324 cluster bacterium]|nr:DsbA family protein [SAR324 cluster bacterium]MCH2265437.1 DsbA family protein [SAR324 cluster bacterium]
MKEQYGLSLRWTHFPLHPETPDSGLTLEELFRGRGYDIEAMKQRMSGLMAEENLPYGNRSHTYNSRLAQELSKWGESFPEGEALNRKLFEAYFVEGLNLAEAEVLLDVTEATGLSRKAAEEVIRERRFRNAVDADWRRAHELGVTGVPTFFSGTSGLVGAQNYEALEQLIQLE